MHRDHLVQIAGDGRLFGPIVRRRLRTRSKRDSGGTQRRSGKCLRLGFVRKYGFRHGNEGADWRCRRLFVLLGFLYFLVAALLTFGHDVSPCCARWWRTCFVQWAGASLRSVGITQAT